MGLKQKINFRIHHCRRDINDAAKIIKKKFHGSRFSDLKQSISDSEKLFSIIASTYPPLSTFQMSQDYFDCNWSNINSISKKYDNLALLKVKRHIEKAIRRSDNFLSDDEFISQRQSLLKIIDAVNL